MAVVRVYRDDGERHDALIMQNATEGCDFRRLLRMAVDDRFDNRVLRRFSTRDRKVSIEVLLVFSYDWPASDANPAAPHTIHGNFILCVVASDGLRDVYVDYTMLLDADRADKLVSRWDVSTQCLGPLGGPTQLMNAVPNDDVGVVWDFVLPRFAEMISAD